MLHAQKINKFKNISNFFYFILEGKQALIIILGLVRKVISQPEFTDMFPAVKQQDQEKWKGIVQQIKDMDQHYLKIQNRRKTIGRYSLFFNLLYVNL